MDMIRLSIAILFCISSVVIAQESDTSRVCWRARALANCKSWLVTETAVEIPIYSSMSRWQGYPSGGSYPSDDFATRVALTLGGMRNLRPNAGVGLTATLATTEHSEESITRVEARYRRWTGARAGLDLSGGYTGGRVRATDRSSFRPTTAAHGVTGSIGVSTTYLGIDVRHDVLRTVDGRLLQGSHVSIRAGSRLAPVGLLAVMYLAAAVSIGAYT